MKISFMRLDRQFQSIRDEIMEAVALVFGSGYVLQSKEVTVLEDQLAALHGLKHCVAVNSGTDALTMALAGLSLPQGSKVAITAMSFVASGASILHGGCRPIFIDVDPATMLMDTGVLLDLVDRREVDAVVAVHLYGQLLDLDAVADLAGKRGIPILEDSAQVLGAERNGQPSGRHGRATCLSFDPTKVIGAYGSGGAVLTNDDELASTIRLLRYHGHAGGQRYVRPGFNSQMDSVQAAILSVKLRHIAAWQVRRTEIAMRYATAVKSSGALRTLAVLPGNTHNFHKYVLWAENREQFQRHMGSQGIDTKIQYPIPMHQQPIFSAPRQVLPKVEKAASHIVSLPMYPELTDTEINRITEAVAAFR